MHSHPIRSAAGLATTLFLGVAVPGNATVADHDRGPALARENSQAADGVLTTQLDHLKKLLETGNP
jgi:hypothetical protein